MIFKKSIFIFICFFYTLSVKAQLDLEHWFPPFFQSTTGISDIKIYLSTDKTTPFKVNIYNDNTLINSVTLSNSSPIEYTLPDDAVIRTNVERRTMVPSSMGLYIAGEKSFYASLRISGSYTEIMASKGKSAIGKEFFVVNDQVVLYEDPANPINAPKMNYQAAIMATQDNTQIKIFGYNKNLLFCNGIKDDFINITLNRGQSYILAALKKDNKDPHPPHPVLDDNDPNLIGAIITSDKPIVVNNGNFLSQDLGESGGNVNLDQSVPTSKIGKEYFFTNGMTVSESAMEKAIIVATKNNTKIFFNDETKPFKTLDQGEYYIGPYPNKFILGGEPSFTNSAPKEIPTKGLYIKTSEPCYVYQMIGGFNDIPRGAAPPLIEKTSGMSFSYPLDKNYLPIDKQNLIQVPKIEKIGSSRNDIKLTIKSEQAANIFVNGNLQGIGTSISGKTGWKYNTIPYLNGNVNISSDKSLNLDVMGGRPNTGFASSYTGYSNDPYITKNGNCIQEKAKLILQNPDFEYIQWQKDGIDIPNANSSTYIPTTSGSYRCKVTYAYGDFSFYTNEINVDNCPYNVSEITLNTTCSGSSLIISPQFSPPNTKYEIVKTEILTPPLSSSYKVTDTDIVITPQSDFSGENRIVYKITSDKGYYEIFNAKFSVIAVPSLLANSPLIPITGTKNTFNLTEAIANNVNPDYTYQYYNTEEEAKNLKFEIKNPTTFSTKNKYIYLRISNKNNCYSILSVKLSQSDFTIDPPIEAPETPEFNNIFTPNGDNLNDSWNFQKLKDLTHLKIYIFNREGEKVYEYKEGSPLIWKGTDLQNRKLPSGTYWISIEALNEEKNQIIHKNLWLYLRNRN